MSLVTSELSSDMQASQVLVVDDSASMREGIAAILRHMGCQVTTACNGAEGYRKAQALSPDLILSDLEMPEANGFELLSSVRSDAALTMVPFIMITGVADRSSTRRAMELGADDYLTKPFTPDEVICAVRSRLDKQRNWRQATQALAASYSQGMMGVLPHEFRTPLSSILGFAELMALMADKGLSPKQTREFAETIQRSGKTLLSHTTRFLTLTEYQSLQSLGPTTPVFTITADWVGRQVDDILADQLPTNQVKASVDIVECPLKCREDLLRMMLRELAGNAVKFAESGSTIRVSGTLEGSSYQLRFENAGPQFPVNRIRNIGAFVQFDRDRQEQQGLGIGLAIVSHAARLSQALLDIRNMPPGTVRINLRLRLA